MYSGPGALCGPGSISECIVAVAQQVTIADPSSVKRHMNPDWPPNLHVWPRVSTMPRWIISILSSNRQTPEGISNQREV